MNTETGKIYSNEEDVVAAEKRGEPLVPVSEKAAKRIVSGRKLLAQKIRADRRKLRNRKKDRLQKLSRKANR